MTATVTTIPTTAETRAFVDQSMKHLKLVKSALQSFATVNKLIDWYLTDIPFERHFVLDWGDGPTLIVVRPNDNARYAIRDHDRVVHNMVRIVGLETDGTFVEFDAGCLGKLTLGHLQHAVAIMRQSNVNLKLESTYPVAVMRGYQKTPDQRLA